MRVVIYETKEQGLAFSHAEIQKSAGYSPTHGTEWKYLVKEGINGQWAVLIGDAVVEGDVVILDDSWFPKLSSQPF